MKSEKDVQIAWTLRNNVDYISFRAERGKTWELGGKAGFGKC